MESVVSSPVLFLTVTVIVGFALARVFRRRQLRLPPGPPGLPIFGNYFTLMYSKVEPRELYMQWSKQYGDMFMYNIFGTNFLIITKFTLAQEVYMNEDIHCRAPIMSCNKALNRPNTSFGLIGSSDDNNWNELRSFLHGYLRDVKHHDLNFESHLTEQAEKFVQKLSESSGSYIDLRDDIFITVGNVTTDIVSGKTYEYDDDEFIRFSELTQGVFEYLTLSAFSYHVPILGIFPTSVSRKGDIVMKKIFEFIDEIIKRRREAIDFADAGYEPTTLVDVFLMEQHKRETMGRPVEPYDDTNLAQLVWDIYAAAFEPIVTSLLWYYLMMAQHPDVQSRVQAELDDAVGRGRMPKVADRANTPFTEATMTECYRLSGMVPVTTAHRAARDLKIRGYDVPKGSYISMHPTWMSYSPEIWENPMELRPERFLDKQGKFNAKLDATLGEFGIGRRACLGEQLSRNKMYIFFSHVLHRFTLHLPEGTPITLEGINAAVYNPLPYKIRTVPRDA